MTLDRNDWEKTAFACHTGLYPFRVIPFRLANATGIFQQLMSVVLGGLEQFAMAYLDNVLVFSDDILVDRTQALAVVRFSICETTKFSPYYMLFGHDVVLLVDNLLRPRRKYVGEDHHRLVIKQHTIFAQAQRRIKRTQKRRKYC